VSEFRRNLVELLPRLRRFALSLCGSSHEAEDLVQSAIERALRNQEKWRVGSRLDSWMFRIVQNLWLDEVSAHRRRTASIDLIMDMPGEDGRTTLDARAQLAEVRMALQSLPTEHRVTLALIVVDGMSYQEAAATLGVPIGTIMSRISRGRALLNDALGGSRPNLKAARHD
jgi:RNA polymerase sigma-70 factor, ECF subfamily